MPEGQVCGQPLGRFQSRNSLGQFKHSHQTCWFCNGHFSRTCRPAKSDLQSISSRALRESMPEDIGSLENWQRSPFQVCQKFELDLIRESGFHRSPTHVTARPFLQRGYRSFSLSHWRRLLYFNQFVGTSEQLLVSNHNFSWS